MQIVMRRCLVFKIVMCIDTYDGGVDAKCLQLPCVSIHAMDASIHPEAVLKKIEFLNIWIDAGFVCVDAY